MDWVHQPEGDQWIGSIRVINELGPSSIGKKVVAVHLTTDNTSEPITAR